MINPVQSQSSLSTVYRLLTDGNEPGLTKKFSFCFAHRCEQASERKEQSTSVSETTQEILRQTTPFLSSIFWSTFIKIPCFYQQSLHSLITKCICFCGLLFHPFITCTFMNGCGNFNPCVVKSFCLICLFQCFFSTLPKCASENSKNQIFGCNMII